MVRLTPTERREALIAATLPLLRTQGFQVSTRQIAEAAGVAEGTIFRVFPDKAALIRACMQQACDPAPIIESLENLPEELDLHTKLSLVGRIVRKRWADNLSLVVALRSSGLVTVHAEPCADPGALEKSDDNRGRRDNLEPAVKAVAALLEPDRDQLLHSPETIARMLLALVTTQPGLPLRDVVSVLLDGALRPTDLPGNSAPDRSAIAELPGKSSR